jgi:Fe-S oxidoreductase
MDAGSASPASATCPVFQRNTLPALVQRHTGAGRSPTQGTVTLLADSFTSFTEPGIGQAVVQLLERAGHRVGWRARAAAGAPSISKGMLDDARDKAQKLAASLCDGAEPGSPIVGCEPSCILTLRPST